jgi:NADPH:quinone reductase-like Zn-dependent oxidoreductase
MNFGAPPQAQAASSFSATVARAHFHHGVNMQAAFAKPGGGIDALELREMPVPSAGPGQALVRLKAATINYRDLLFISGRLRGHAKEPEYIPLCSATGEVVAVGSGVARVKLNDRVAPTYYRGWIDGDKPKSSVMVGATVDGVACEYAIFAAEDLCVVPDELGDLEAATLSCSGLTGWTALFGPRPIKRGEWVLLQGTGGVSLAALQWAKAFGAHVAITSSSNAKLRRARALGADVTINYREHPHWADAVRTQLRHGVDIVVDVVGATQLDMSASVLNEGGLIAAIGMLDGDFSWSRPLAGKPLVPIMVGNRVEFESMLAFAAQHGIRPVVDVVYDLARLQDAMHRAARGDFFGKVGINLE